MCENMQRHKEVYREPLTIEGIQEAINQLDTAHGQICNNIGYISFEIDEILTNVSRLLDTAISTIGGLRFRGNLSIKCNNCQKEYPPDHFKGNGICMTCRENIK